MVRRAAWVVACLLAPLAWGQALVVGERETAVPPSNERISTVLAAAARDGWAPQRAPLRAAALRAYRTSSLATAETWFDLYAWASLLGEDESRFVTRWIAAVTDARVGHSNMPRSVPAPHQPLALHAGPELQGWMLRDAAFSREFVATITPVDYLPRVFDILDTIRRRAPTDFVAYRNLALAIAVVQDVAPPPNWPHGQVSAAALPRHWPDPVETFRWWVRQDRDGRTFFRLTQLPPDELKFVIDAAAPAAELGWVQDSIGSFDDLPKAYGRVRYRKERVVRNEPVWPGRTYRLEDVLATGGICADQAYFATEAGKARGVPTLLFHGAGNDARHAWFGYLNANRTWVLDIGRYAEEGFVTGYAVDPQTWREITDHELQFLQEHFHALLSYRQSRVHEAFAADLLASGDALEAIRAARAAVTLEPRNQDGWETLVAAQRARGDVRAAEVALREAALAFRRYPDLETYYVARVADSLRARGQTSEAEEEIRQLAQRYRWIRRDLSVKEAGEIVTQATEQGTLAEQMQTFRRAVDHYGSGGGMNFFDQVVVPFIDHLMQLHHRAEARDALAYAQRALDVQAGSQLATEMSRLAGRIDAAR